MDSPFPISAFLLRKQMLCARTSKPTDRPFYRHVASAARQISSAVNGRLINKHGSLVRTHQPGRRLTDLGDDALRRSWPDVIIASPGRWDGVAETMHESAYDDFEQRELILRDRLAIDRTALANERTFLAYVRTALALAIVGGSLFKLFDSAAADLTGGLLLAGGILTLLIGFIRFSRVRRRLTLSGRQIAAHIENVRPASLQENE